MRLQRDVLRQVAQLAVLTAAGVLLMWAVYWALGRLDARVLLGGAIGWVLAVANFLVLSIIVSDALDRVAKGEEPGKAQLRIQLSSTVRPLVLIAIYFVLLRSGVCDLLSAVLPVLIAQVALKLLGIFRKDGDAVS